MQKAQLLHRIVSSKTMSYNKANTGTTGTTGTTGRESSDSFFDEDVMTPGHKGMDSSAGLLGNEETDHDGSGASNSSSATDAAKELRDTVIRDEERAVRKVRILVGACVAACGIAITVAVYLLGKAKSDQVVFEQDVSQLLL